MFITICINFCHSIEDFFKLISNIKLKHWRKKFQKLKLFDHYFKLRLYWPHVEVLYIDIFVWGCLSLAPQEETFLSWGFFDRDVLDGESENDRPNHTEGHFDVTVNDFFCTNRDQSDSLNSKINFENSDICSFSIYKIFSLFFIGTLDWIKSRALLTLAILWNRIFPRSGLGRRSPEITSSKSISLSPARKSVSIRSIWVPALRRCELHHAVKVWTFI